MICNFCNLNVTFSKSYKKEHSQSFKCMSKAIRMLFDICNFSGEDAPISIKKVCKNKSLFNKKPYIGIILFRYNLEWLYILLFKLKNKLRGK